MESTSFESLEKILAGLWADPIAYTFLVIIMAWLAFSVLSLNSESSNQTTILSYY